MLNSVLRMWLWTLRILVLIAEVELLQQRVNAAIQLCHRSRTTSIVGSESDAVFVVALQKAGSKPSSSASHRSAAPRPLTSQTPQP